MSWQGMALLAAGSIGSVVALAHGVLVERRIARPLQALVAGSALPPRSRRILRPLLHASTFAWLVGGLALITSSIWLGLEATRPLAALVGVLFLFGAVANLWAVRAAHPGWILMSAAVALILAAVASGAG